MDTLGLEGINDLGNGRPEARANAGHDAVSTSCPSTAVYHPGSVLSDSDVRIDGQ
jgi:hypothetical protein